MMESKYLYFICVFGLSFGLACSCQTLLSADRYLVVLVLKQTRLLFDVMRNVSSSAARPVPVNTSMCWPAMPLPVSVARKVFDDPGAGKIEICTCAPVGIKERSIGTMPAVSRL